MDSERVVEPASSASATEVPVPTHPLTEAAALRAQENRRQWNSYLPQECVDSMIRMGWDVST